MLARFHRLPLFLLLVGVLASLVALGFRYRTEARSRSVALVLDYAQFRTLVGVAGVPVGKAYRQFRDAGITGVALTEDTLADLQTEGSLQVRAVPAPGGREYRVETADPAVADRVADYVPRFARSATERQPQEGDRVVFPGPGGGKIYVPARWDDIRGVPIGLDPLLVKQVRDAGLEPVGRINNPLGLTAESLRWSLKRVKDGGVRILIFAGEEVLGYRGLMEETAQAFREMDLLYGSVEMGKQRGDDFLARKLEDRLVRVHSISGAEMPRLSPEEAVERYVRAAAERNIRLDYVRLPGAVTAQTFEDSLDYVRKLSSGLRAADFTPRHPAPLGQVWEPPMLGRVVAALIGLGIGAGAVVLLAGMVPLSLRLQALLAAGAGLFCAALAFSGTGLGLELVALLAAVVFPTLGFVLFPQPIGAFTEHEHALVPKRSDPTVPALAEFAAISLVTLAGALMVGGVLSDLSFMVKVRSFEGIKAATVIPLFLVAWMYLTGMSGLYPSWEAERKAMEERLRGFFSEPVRVWHALAFVVGVVALALLVARSGNDPGVGVSASELRFRALLDRILGVRPRTKEFLMGHPALLLALAMATLPRWRPWALPLLLVGAIGQVGMLNSFCHLHSPLALTVLRTLHGLWLGILIGLAAIALWLRFWGRRRGGGEPLRL
jgi:hypothetical protein